MPYWGFTEEDQLFPVYCLTCRTHIPKGMSNTQLGLCNPCYVAWQDSQRPLPPPIPTNDQQPSPIGAERNYPFRASFYACFECDESGLTSWERPNYQKRLADAEVLLGFAELGPELTTFNIAVSVPLNLAELRGLRIRGSRPIRPPRLTSRFAPSELYEFLNQIEPLDNVDLLESFTVNWPPIKSLIRAILL